MCGGNLSPSCLYQCLGIEAWDGVGCYKGMKEERHPADPGGQGQQAGIPTEQGERSRMQGRAAGECKRGERSREGGKHDT